MLRAKKILPVRFSALLLVVEVFASIQEIKCGYCHVDTTGKTVTCKGKGTMNIIELPIHSGSATTLDIRNGNFSHLTSHTFLNLTNSSITSLKMIKCGILSIQKDAFLPLNKIEELDLSRNFRGLTVTNISKSLQSLSRIKKLSLNYMGWPTLPENMFDGLNDTNITVISLNHNLLTKINGNTFAKLKTLRKLDLSWNGLKEGSMTFEGLSQITNLSLSGNWFSYFPEFCDNDSVSFMPNLTELNLDKSKIFTLHKTISCLNKLQDLNLTGITLRRLYPNTFSKLKSLKRLSLFKLSPQLLVINSTAFNSSSLEELRFSVSTGYKFTNENMRHFNLSMFEYCTNLSLLDLSHNRIHLSDDNLMKMFKPLAKLKTLVLKEMKMKVIPNNLGRVFGNTLESLDLSNNKIQSWTEAYPFLGFNNLTSLNLSGNKISMITGTSFPAPWMSGKGPLRYLYLNGNPFSCTCELIWFRNWMDLSENRNITTDKGQWTCFSSKKIVLDYQPSNSIECLMTYIVTSLVGLFIILTIGLGAYICRWKIRLKLYKFRSNWHAKQKGYLRLPGNEYKYDCFVVYSYGDIKWIKDTLIPQMEEKHRRRLCIPDRDFRLGTVFSYHLIESIESSQTVLFAMSNNFARDKWCEFQHHVTCHMNISAGRPAMIPVLLEDIKFKTMTEMIYRTLHNGKYLRWTEGESSEEVFWAELMDKIHSSCQTYDDFYNRRLEESTDTYDSGFQQSMVINS